MGVLILFPILLYIFGIFHDNKFLKMRWKSLLNSQLDSFLFKEPALNLASFISSGRITDSSDLGSKTHAFYFMTLGIALGGNKINRISEFPLSSATWE